MHSRLRSDAFHHCPNECPWSEVLTGTAFGIFGVFLQQAFVDVAFNIGTHHHPALFIDHVDDPIELGWVLNLVLGLGEDLAEHSLLLA